MTCTSCGDKPKGSSKGFPRAVVEINNPESLVLLRKVVIPVSMGTEEDVPPAIGKYFNVLLQYESNGHIYLYSSDGIPTAIEANIPQEVLDRIDQLEIDVDLLETGLAKETEDREKADGVLQQEIDDIKNSPDVVDIVATYSDLMAYDTSSLGDNDVIRVLRDETHDGQSAYYRWDKPHSTWTFIGTVGDYYTKQQVDTLLDGKQDELTPGENISIVDESGDLVISAQDTTYTAGYGLELNGTEFSVDPDIVQDTLTAGDNITIEDESGSLVISATDTTYTAGTGLALNGTQFSVDTTAIATQSDLTAGLATKQDTLTAGANVQINNNTISATDTTYSDFTGTDGTAAGAAGLVPAPATTDAGKFLKADGTWDTVGSSVNVVQAPGTSTTDVMSQNATTSMVFADPATMEKIKIGAGTSSSEGVDGVEIGHNAGATAAGTIAIGSTATASGSYGAMAIGLSATARSNRSVALGPTSFADGAYSIALGKGARATVQGQFDVSTGVDTTSGYNFSNYRLLTGLYDGQSAHDAATKGQLDAAVTTIDTALDAKQDELTPGTGISITEESGALVISATGAQIATINAQDWSALWQ